MVKLKFIIRNNTLVLRISENKERYYKTVKHLLTGNPNIERHWNENKERFSSYANSYVENNQTLDNFKKLYTNIILENPEFSAKQVAQFYSGEKQTTKEKESPEIKTPNMNRVADFLEIVIEREKAKTGCNFELYHKLHKKCSKILKGFHEITFQSIDYDKCVSIAKVFSKHKGYKNTSKSFRNLLGKASRDSNIDFTITQIGDFSFKDYDPKINETNTKKPDVLTPEQLKKFLNLDIKTITPTFRDRNRVELYYDFCVFMFHSFMAPCDVIKLKYSDLDKYGVFNIKRKKTHKHVELPANKILQNIVEKYKGKTKNGYVFPIMDDEKSKKYKTKDFLFKRFREQVNIWLKHIGKELGTEFGLYAYVFRHTSITVALDNGIPLTYVANVAGTSVEMIQDHYYNGNNTKNTERLQQVFLNAAQ